MLKRNEIEIPQERGRTKSITEVLIEMGYLTNERINELES